MSSYVRFTLVLTIVCVSAAAGIGGVYLVTEKPIDEKRTRTENDLRAQVLPGAQVFDEVVAGSGVYAGRADRDGPVLGYVAVGEAGGYGGRLQVMVGLDGDLVVTKAAVLSQGETPGLGADLGKYQSSDTLSAAIMRAYFGGEAPQSHSWMDQFAKKPVGRLILGSGIDAKTGCTITSRAIVTAAREAVDKARRALATSE
jgi:electron transport complex protein RnfG